MKKIPIENETIAQVYVETRSIKKTAERLGMTISTVDKRLHQAGVVRNGQHGLPRKLPPTIDTEYLAGASMNQLAAKYSASLATVAEALHRAGITSRRRGGLVKEANEALRRKVIDMYSTMPQSDIARTLKISQPRVSRLLRSEGITDDRVPQGSRHGSWKGGRIKSGAYWAVWMNLDDPMVSMRNALGYVQEHRLVMARHIGRPIEKHETVHHINGDPSDNRIENLQLRSGHHGTGVVHRCRDCGSTNIESTRLN